MDIYRKRPFTNLDKSSPNCPKPTMEAIKNPTVIEPGFYVVMPGKAEWTQPSIAIIAMQGSSQGIMASSSIIILEFIIGYLQLAVQF